LKIELVKENVDVVVSLSGWWGTKARKEIWHSIPGQQAHPPHPQVCVWGPGPVYV